MFHRHVHFVLIPLRVDDGRRSETSDDSSRLTQRLCSLNHEDGVGVSSLRQLGPTPPHSLPEPDPPATGGFNLRVPPPVCSRSDGGHRQTSRLLGRVSPLSLLSSYPVPLRLARLPNGSTCDLLQFVG